MNINEELKSNKIFRSMWADDYSTVDDMEERFKNELTGQVGDSELLRIEIRIAINTLDMEMREAFLVMNYDNGPQSVVDRPQSVVDRPQSVVDRPQSVVDRIESPDKTG